MDISKLSNKRERAIAQIESEMKGWEEKVEKMDEVNFNAYWKQPLGLSECEVSDGGVSAEEAFFNWSERGVKPTRVINIRRLAFLMAGHKRLAVADNISKGRLGRVEKV
jgi:hypothetical protein